MQGLGTSLLRPPAGALRSLVVVVCALLLAILPACDDDVPPEDDSTEVREPATEVTDESLVESSTAEEAMVPECSTTGLISILGHRGIGWNDEQNPYPENTVISALAALDAGAAGAEIDVTKTADDVIVLAHENALHFKNPDGQEKTSCSGYIMKSTWEEIQDCQALSYMDGGMEEPLDRLEELFSAAPEADFIIDVKNDQAEVEPWVTVYSIYRAAEAAGTQDNITLMLYRPETIRFALTLGLRSCLKVHFRKGLTDAQIADQVMASGATGICAYSKLLSEEFIAQHLARDLTVSTYYLGSDMSDESFDRHLADWLEWGLDSVVTDRIGRGAFLMEQAACGHFP